MLVWLALIVVLFAIGFYILWQRHVIMPIYAIRNLIGEYYLSGWGGENSARYRIPDKHGPLWIGYNCGTRHEFLIYNGTEINWQLQNFKPRFALWGPRPWWMYPKEKVMPDLGEAEIRRMSGVKLGKLSPDHPMRAVLEDEMRRSVESQVEKARSIIPSFSRRQAITLLYFALQRKPRQFENSFSMWISRRGKLLGTKDCYRIGKSVCDEHGFTSKESERLFRSLEPVLR